MLTLPPSVHVYVTAEPTGLRKCFDGLSLRGREMLSLSRSAFRISAGSMLQTFMVA